MQSLGRHEDAERECDVSDVTLAAAAPEIGFRYVNLGCGARRSLEFINIDINEGPGVIRHDLSLGIPLPTDSCDAVYQCAMLPNVKKPVAANLIKECYRVLKVGGILRVGIEDLEQLCRSVPGVTRTGLARRSSGCVRL